MSDYDTTRRAMLERIEKLEKANLADRLEALEDEWQAVVRWRTRLEGLENRVEALEDPEGDPDNPSPHPRFAGIFMGLEVYVDERIPEGKVALLTKKPPPGTG